MREVVVLTQPAGAMTRNTRHAAAEALAGRRRGLAALLPFLGPAFLASVAYMDPGNVATNIQAGSRFGLNLLWVVVVANVVAMLFQALSARLGIATGRNLAELCRDAVPVPVAWLLWGITEIAVMATDVAEFLGAAVALSLLFGLPLLVGTLITAIATYALLMTGSLGFRPLEALIGALVAVMGLCYLLEVLIAPPDWGAVAIHAVTPWLGDDSLMLVAGIVGATVMPHALFLHSALTQRRIPPANPAEARRIARYSDLEVALALGLAGLVNIAMLVMAATVFHDGHAEVADIETAYLSLAPLLGAAAAGVFLAALLASGLSSSVVGTMAGQVVMQGFVRVRIPVWLRRLVTMIPTVIIVAMGIDPTGALVASQVVLSFVLPVPMIALVVLTARPGLMGTLVCPRPVTALAAAAALVVIVLNLVLVADSLGMLEN